ncbi:MAG: hypothetical protein ACK55I_20575, partial [bacterium]
RRLGRVALSAQQVNNGRPPAAGSDSEEHRITQHRSGRRHRAADGPPCARGRADRCGGDTLGQRVGAEELRLPLRLLAREDGPEGRSAPGLPALRGRPLDGRGQASVRHGAHLGHRRAGQAR